MTQASPTQLHRQNLPGELIRFALHGGWCRGGNAGDITRTGAGSRDPTSTGMGECAREHLPCSHSPSKLVSLEANASLLRAEAIKFNVPAAGDAAGMGAGMAAALYSPLISKHIWTTGHSVHPQKQRPPPTQTVQGSRNRAPSARLPPTENGRHPVSCSPASAALGGQKTAARWEGLSPGLRAPSRPP